MNRRKLEALEHNSEIAELFGFSGSSSEFTDNVSLLTRDYIAHVSILPVVLTAVVGVHLLLVKRLRVAPLPWGSPDEIEGRKRDEKRVSFTSHLARIGYWTLVVFDGEIRRVGCANPVLMRRSRIRGSDR